MLGFLLINVMEMSTSLYIKYLKFYFFFFDFGNSPLPSQSVQCMLLNMRSLAYKCTTLSLPFDHDIICNAFDSPEILEYISFNIPLKTLQAYQPFKLKLVKLN